MSHVLELDAMTNEAVSDEYGQVKRQLGTDFEGVWHSSVQGKGKGCV